MSKVYRKFKKAWRIMYDHPSNPTMRRYRQVIHKSEMDWKHTGRDDIAPYYISRHRRKVRLSGTGWVRYNNILWDYLNSGVVVGHAMLLDGEWYAYRLAPFIDDAFYLDTFSRRCKTRAEAMKFVEGNE